MKKGKAVRIYSVNKERLREALKAIDDLIKPLKDAIKRSEAGG